MPVGAETKQTRKNKKADAAAYLLLGRRPSGVSVEAIRRPYSVPPAPGYRTHRVTPRQRTGGHAPQPAGPSSPPLPQWDDLFVRHLGRRADDGIQALRPLLQRLGLLVLILMKVVGADDAGWPVCKDCFRDVVRDAQCRQTGANDAAQIVVDPTAKVTAR